MSWLAGGGGLAEFAERRGISTSTARWHLKNVHQKTETRSIGELVAAALTLSAPFDLI